MARRAKKDFDIATVFLFAVFLIAIVAVALKYWLVILLALLLIGAAVVLSGRVKENHRASQRQRFLRAVGLIVTKHTDDLVRRRAQLVRVDPYGKVLTDKWAKEIDYFLKHHVVASLTAEERLMLNDERETVIRNIDEHVELVARERPLFATFSESLTPTEFEMFCAEQLKLSGWEADVTSRSRDQGVDIIAEKNGLRVALQCKLYSGPVGNKAVQEIGTGRVYAQAHRAAVVTNSRYTSAAEQLAATNRILLLHYSDLAKLDAILQQPEKNPTPL